jgi:hypothetical protein
MQRAARDATDEIQVYDAEINTLNDRIDAAYRAKYSVTVRAGSIDGGPEARATTIRLVPRSAPPGAARHPVRSFLRIARGLSRLKKQRKFRPKTP